MTDATAPILDISDLHVSFPTPRGAVHALRGVSLQIQPGEIVGLVGESGSGKSVLGYAALGLLPTEPAPQLSGSLILDGLDMVTADPEERRKKRGPAVGAVFQDPMSSLNPTMRIGKQVAESSDGASDAEVIAMLEATGIRDAAAKARSYPHELSGGLRQRVMIAMALARHPKLIIADEATTALDVTVQAQVLDLLAAAARERGVALLLITHDLGVAARICDRIAVAYAGEIVETGPVTEVLESPRHPYTLGLLACRPDLGGVVRGGELPTLPGLLPDPRSARTGCAFAARCPAATEVCGSAVPVHGGERTMVRCHHPGALDVWPPRGTAAAAGLPGSVPEAGHVADALHLDTLAGPALETAALVREFRLPRPRPWAKAPAPLRAVDGIDLRVPPGGSLAIVGESGSGKSTLLRMIVGLMEPTSGSIALAPAAAGPQMVFQDAGASLTPWRTIGELITERLAVAGVPAAERPARVIAALDAVGLDRTAAPMLPRRLSGGQRQRAAIARAIAVPPALLACDEPVSALDVSLAAQVLNLLCRLRDELGIALLFVTHDLATARAVADDIIVMRQGKVVERGRTADVFEHPQHPYTQELLAAVPSLTSPQVVVA